MAERAPEPGDTPVGGSRRPSRQPHSAPPSAPPSDDTAEPSGDWPPGIRPILDKPLDTACPWLYLGADPDARAAFVTAEHRCEIRPDEVPGPGHQLAYCLTTNHISCPQLRSYEARRRSEAVEAVPDSAYVSRPAPPPQPQPAVADFRASMIGGGGRASAARTRGFAASRIVWAAAGAVGALVFAASLVLYSSPDSVASSEPDTAPASLPQAAAATEVPLTARSVATATSTAEDTTDPEPLSGASETDIDALSALGPGSTAAGPDEAPVVEATPEVEATPRPTYIVRPGDTLGQIAQNLQISVVELAIANNITTSTLIFVGDRLFLPPVAEATPAATAVPAGEFPPSN